MKPCWRDAGLTEEGARQAEEILPALIPLVERFGAGMVETALKEAKFRVFELPRRTREYQSRYRRENGA